MGLSLSTRARIPARAHTRAQVCIPFSYLWQTLDSLLEHSVQSFVGEKAVLSLTFGVISAGASSLDTCQNSERAPSLGSCQNHSAGSKHPHPPSQSCRHLMKFWMGQLCRDLKNGGRMGVMAGEPRLLYTHARLSLTHTRTRTHARTDTRTSAHAHTCCRRKGPLGRRR